MGDLAEKYQITKQGDKVVISKALWEDVQDLAEHIYLYDLVEKRKNSKTKYNLNELLKEEGLSCEDLGRQGE